MSNSRPYVLRDLCCNPGLFAVLASRVSFLEIGLKTEN